MECEICLIRQQEKEKGRVVDLGPDWSINPYVGPGTRPRWVLQSQRHVTSIAHLHDGELASMGRAIGHALKQIKKADPKIENVYVLSFNETKPGHPHIHLVPRYENELPDPTKLTDDLEFEVEDYAMEVCKKLQRSKEKIDLGNGIVRKTRSAINFWNSKISPYVLFTKISLKSQRKNFDAGESYVFTWIGILIFLLLLISVSTSAGFPVFLDAVLKSIASFLALFRLADIAIYSLGILLTTYKSVLQSVARSLILFLLNLFELFLIGSILLISSGNGVFDSISNAAGVINASGTNATVNDLGVIFLGFTSAVALEVFALGIGMIVGKVGETFRDQSR